MLLREEQVSHSCQRSAEDTALRRSLQPRAQRAIDTQHPGEAMEGTAEFRAAEGALWLRNGTEVGTTQCKRKWDSPAPLASQPISVGHSRSIESVLMALRDAKAVGSEPSSKKHQQEVLQGQRHQQEVCSQAPTAMLNAEHMQRR